MKFNSSFRRITSVFISFSYCAALIAPSVTFAADPNAQTIEDAAASLASGTVSDDFPTAMSGLVGDSSPNKCNDFGEAVSAGLQAAATATDSLTIQSKAPDVVEMSQSVATSLLSLFTSYCAAPPPPGQNGPKIEITIKDCQEIRLQLDQCKRDLDNSKRDIGDFKNELGRCQENVKTLLAKIAERDATIAQLQKDIAAKDAEILSLKEQLKACKSEECTKARNEFTKISEENNALELKIEQLKEDIKILERRGNSQNLINAKIDFINKFARSIAINNDRLKILLEQINAHCGNNGVVPNIGNPRNGVRDDARGTNSNRGNTNKNRNTGTAKKPSGNSRTKR